MNKILDTLDRIKTNSIAEIENIEHLINDYEYHQKYTQSVDHYNEAFTNYVKTQLQQFIGPRSYAHIEQSNHLAKVQKNVMVQFLTITMEESKFLLNELRILRPFFSDDHYWDIDDSVLRLFTPPTDANNDYDKV